MNSPVMREFRINLLNGEPSKICSSCQYQDSLGKVSGRLKQLLKSAVDVKNFDRTFCSSPHFSMWEHSYDNSGHTNYMPVDLQIDLGNTCNSACVMCIPTYSSRLAEDYKKLGQIEPELFPEFPTIKNWADDELLVDKFVNELATIPNIRYIHFLGGETLYFKSFYTICNKLIDRGLAKDIAIGTTTNGTLYTNGLEHIIKNFKHVHLGVSIETATTLNNYIRWPSQVDTVLANVKKFLALRDKLHISLRITPNVFTIYHLDSLLEFMLEHRVTAESCDFLRKPSWLRTEILPKDLRQTALDKINAVIDRHQIQKNTDMIVNQRSESLVDQVIAMGIYEYKEFLESLEEPADVEEERYKLVKFIKSFEQLRGNNILEHLPEYEEFLRSYGY
jgi:MoaA/NifB/PqqE/SkfB family radical SAM enzyme